MAPVIDLVVCVTLISLSAVGGWWLRGSNHRPKTDERKTPEDVRRARAALARFKELITRVAAEVSEHNNRLGQINDQLKTAEEQDAELVLAAVARLVEVNEQAQQQLVDAEARLHDQARLLQIHEAEARTDPLTGLPNRRALDQEIKRRVGQFQRQGQPLSVMLVDVDHFKKFNDSHGHQAGDKVLRGVARVLKQTIREMDMVARYGGEEFTAVLPDAGIDDARGLAERARKSIEQATFEFAGKRLRVTASFGVAEMRDDEDASDLLKRADEALYAAKSAGRNRTHWHDGRNTRPASDAGTVESDESFPGKLADAVSPRIEEPAPATPESDDRRAPAEVDAVGSAKTPRPLCNRTSFCHLVRQHVRDWKRGGSVVSVMLVEIDRYDEIVAQHGRRAGLLVSEATGRFLQALARETDAVGHYAPGCLALMLSGVALADATMLAERLRQAISRYRVPMDNGSLQYHVSVGVAEPSGSDDLIQFFERAEAAVRDNIFLQSGSTGASYLGHPGQALPAPAAVATRSAETSVD
jgi:diguanylate cyclase